MENFEIKSHRLWNDLRNWGALANVLLLAIVLRTVFLTGMAPAESIHIAKAAYTQTTTWFGEAGQDVSHFSLDQINDLRAEFGDRRLIFALPISLLYHLFGVSDLTSLSYSFLVSILGIILIYQLTLILIGEKAAIISAFLWAILPSDIFFGTTLLPHVPQTMFGLLALLTYLSAEKSTGEKKKRLVYYAMSLITLLLSIAVLRSGGLVFFYLVSAVFVIRVSKYWNLWRVLIIGFMIWLLVSFRLLYRFQNPYILSVVTAEIFSDPLFYILLPFFVGALVWWARRKDTHSILPLIWSAGGFGFLSLAIYGEYEPNILLFALPVVMVVSDYLAAILDLTAVKKIVSTVAIFLLVIALFVGLAPQHLIAPLEPRPAFQWLNPLLVRHFSPIFFGVAIFLSFATVFVFTSEYHKKKRLLVFFLLLTSGLALFFPISQRRAEERFLVNAAKSTSAILRTQTLRLPVYVLDRQIADRLLYEIGFEQNKLEGENDSPHIPIGVMPIDIQLNQSAYILSSASAVDVIPETWWPIERLGVFGDKTFWLYRFLVEEDAEKEFIHADDQLRNNPSLEHELQYYGAAMNVGQTCSGYDAWMRSVDFRTDIIQFIPLSNSQECFSEQLLEENRLLLLDHSHRSNWFSYPENLMIVEAVNQAQIEGTVVSVKRHPHDSVLYDDKSLFQSITMEPESFYLIQITLLSKQEIVPLYWFVDGLEYYFEWGRSIPEWNTITVLLATPDWDTQSKEAIFSPFVFIGDLGVVYIKDFSVSAIRD